MQKALTSLAQLKIDGVIHSADIEHSQLRCKQPICVQALCMLLTRIAGVVALACLSLMRLEVCSAYVTVVQQAPAN